LEKEYNIYDNIYETVKLIPAGRVTSYGAIARYLGATRGARMVGYALNRSIRRDNIPAHRVVNRNGILTGKHHFGSEDEMQKALEAEGVQIIDDQVQNFDKIFWDPSIELAL
jgi:methylated-DNA-protein-cysteine methyltransferase-like protein